MKKLSSIFIKKRKISLIGMIAFIVILGVIPSDVLSMIGNYNYIRTVNELAQDSCQSILNYYMNQLNTELDINDQYLYDMMTNDTDYQKMMFAENKDDRTIASLGVYRAFYTQQLTRYMPTVYYTHNSNNQEFLVCVHKDLDEKASDYQQLIEGSDADMFWQLVDMNGASYFFRKMNAVDGDSIGALINADKLKSTMEASIEYSYEALIIGQNLSVQQIEKQYPGNKVVGASTSKGNISTYIVLNPSAGYRSLRLVNRIAIFLSFACLLLIPVLIYVLRRAVASPIYKINKGLNELERGNSSYRLNESFQTRDFDHMARSFDNMADQIVNLRIESYNQELAKQKVEFQNLQLQVNPHLILNMFNTIFAMASIGNTEDIKKMTLYLSDYFRSLLSNTSGNSLERELEMAAKYFDILRIQFEDCFEVNYFIEEDCKDVMLPTMVLHNLVENIAKYSFQIGNYITIEITARICGDEFVLQVSDDGIGMSQEIVEKINMGKSVYKADGKHIGMSNTSKRLKMMYTEEAVLYIQSAEAEGTQVFIKIPKERLLYDTTAGR